MSSVAIPTKPGGARPPILPPVSTTFDGQPSDDGQSGLNWMSDNVRRTIRQADAADPEFLGTMIEVIESRHKWVSSELEALRMFVEYPLPSVEGFSIDYLLKVDDRWETTLLTLLSQIDDCRERCERRLARYQTQMRLLKSLDTSES